ncbi:MAG: AMP-binding protein, partial [Legionellaceae bacterium]|nr:AMP-binding protein [Legionellaceae bacterium]
MSFNKKLKNSKSKNLTIDSYLNKEQVETTESYTSSILSEFEYNQVIYDWNEHELDFPKRVRIEKLFENQVLKTPNQTALVYQEEHISYKELDELSNQLAHYILRHYGDELSKDTPIVLLLGRSIEVIIGIFGILKAGGAYVPVDPQFPKERIKHILEDTNTSLVLTQSNLESI